MKILFLVTAAHAIFFDARIKAGARKCYTEELAANALFVAEIVPAVPEPLEVTVSMRNPREYYFNETSATAMKTAFTVPKKGHVDVCIRNTNRRAPVSCAVRLLSGALAKDFSQIAKKEHLDPVVGGLRSVEELIKDYRLRQMHLVGKEQGARQIVASTHNRVVMLAGVNIGVLILCNVVTVVWLRSFLRAKKII